MIFRRCLWSLAVSAIVLSGAARTPAEDSSGEYVVAGDVNCDSVLTSADIIYLVNYVFKSGPPPCSAECQPSPALSDREVRNLRVDVARSPLWEWDTLAIDRISICDTSAPLSVGLYVHNHLALYTLVIPLEMRRLHGDGFVHFDSLAWVDRLADPTIVDETFWAIGEVDGTSPDWVYIRVCDFLFTGQPPLDSGAGYICRLYLTPIGGSSEIELTMDNSFGLDEFVYSAGTPLVYFIDGRISVDRPTETGDLNYDLSITAADIISLVNIVFESAAH